MPLSDYGIDPGADFEAMYPDLRRVTVTSVQPDTGAALDLVVHGVKAAKLNVMRDTTGARGGEVGVTTCEWWLRVDQLEFALKPKDTLAEEYGPVWVVNSVEEVQGELCRLPCTLKR